MESTNEGDYVVQQTEESDQKYSEKPPAEVKPCIYVKDYKSVQQKPKYKYIDEKPACIPTTIHGQRLSCQWKKKCGVFPSCRSSYSHDTVREVPTAAHQAEDRSNESERSNKSKHHARNVQENDAKALQRTETELNVNKHRLPTHLIPSKHLQSSPETLKDRTNVAVINNTAAAASHSHPVTWRMKELIDIDKSKYEASKKDLEQAKQNFKDFIRQFDPANELQIGTRRSNSTQVSLVFEENEKYPSLYSENHMKPNSDFKATDARLYLSEDKTSCPSLSIENKGDQLGDSKLRLEMFSIPKTEIVTRDLPVVQPCIAQENLELLCFNVLKEKKDQQELQQGVPKSDLSIIDGSGIQKLHSPGKIEEEKLELMFNVQEKRDYSIQVSHVSGFENELKGTNRSSIEIHQDLIIVETEIDELMKHKDKAFNLEDDSLEDLDNCLKLLRNDKEKLIKVKEMQEDKGSAIARSRIQPEVDSLEAYSVRNCTCHYQSPIFQNTLKTLGSVEGNKSIEMFQPSKLKLHTYKLSLWNLRAELKNVEVAKINSELEDIKSQLLTNGQVKLKTDDDLKEGLSWNEPEALALESIIDEKENQIKELKQHIHNMQAEKNNILLGNINLLCKVQEAKNEARQYNMYVADYIRINEQLLMLAQRKDEEAVSLSGQVARLHIVLSKMTDENKKMSETLKTVAKEMNDLRKQNILLKQHCDLMKLKLRNAETDLLKREELFETISQQVAALFQNQDSLLAEVEQLQSQLQDAKYKQVQIESELIYSNNVINDLKEKICYRDNEMSRLRSEMQEIMKQNVLLKQKEEAKDRDLLNLQNKMANLLHKVQALEEEVMEKEGQIAILKRSFSEEFDY